MLAACTQGIRGRRIVEKPELYWYPPVTFEAAVIYKRVIMIIPDSHLQFQLRRELATA